VTAPVSQADLIAGVDNGCKADSRCVGQIPSRHIGKGPDGGVGDARGFAKERIDTDGGVETARSVFLKRACPQTGVALRCSNPRQRERENEGSNKDEEKRSRVSRMAHINPSVVKVSTIYY
jgi:hypothetical protein